MSISFWSGPGIVLVLTGKTPKGELKVSTLCLELEETPWCDQAEAFIKNAVNKCKEINWEGVLVHLLHTYNTCNKNLKIDEQNGSHYEFTDEEFEIITNI